jgi:hypothetical protein
VQLLQVRPWLDAEFGVKQPPTVAVGLQGVSLPSGGIERGHQQTAQSFPQRVARHQHGKFADNLGCPTRRDGHSRPVLGDGQAQIL